MRTGVKMDYQLITDRLTEESRKIFGENLTGVYLHGSLAMGCFNPDKSDIDLIIVTEEAPTEEQKLQLMEQTVGLNELAPEKGIEMSVVKRSCCEKVMHPIPFELHFSPMHLKWFQENPLGLCSEYEGDRSGSGRTFHDYPPLWNMPVGSGRFGGFR